MSVWPQVTYAYDGTFAGFLTCAAESFAKREYPFYFFARGQEQLSLYPIRDIVTDSSRAKAFYAGLTQELTAEGRQLITYSFLTCLPQRERHIYDYLYLGHHGQIPRDLTDDRVMILTNAVRHLTSEAHLWKGFARFSDYDGVLVGEISPKNRVLPLLRPHFCARYPQDAFLLFDTTHQEALCHTPGTWKLVQLEELELAQPGQEELAYRALWRRFYDAIAIPSRYNPKLRMSNMPKRYWGHMTEFQMDPKRSPSSSSD